MLKQSSLPIARIALDNGFGTQQSFNKYLKNKIGLTPCEYKSSDIYFYFLPLNEFLETYTVNVSAHSFPQAVSLKFYGSALNGIENRAVYKFYKFIEANKLIEPEKVQIFGRNGKQSDNKLCYELMVVSESYDIELLYSELRKSEFNDNEKAEISSGLYATVIIKNNDEDISDAWDYLYNSWLSRSMFECDKNNYFEEYLPGKGDIIKKLKLYLPVRKAEQHEFVQINEHEEMKFLISRKTGLKAEERAAKSIMEFLKNNYPYILNNTKEFYICSDKNNYEYECGILLNTEIKIPEDSDIEIIRYSKGVYATQKIRCCGDYTQCRDRLCSWVSDNAGNNSNEKNKHTLKNSKCFAVYKIDNNFEAENIDMTLYLPITVKNVKNG
jgi:predicted transcriptional regulator YdeE